MRETVGEGPATAERVKGSHGPPRCFLVLALLLVLFVLHHPPLLSVFSFRRRPVFHSRRRPSAILGRPG